MLKYIYKLYYILLKLLYMIGLHCFNRPITHYLGLGFGEKENL